MFQQSSPPLLSKCNCHFQVEVIPNVIGNYFVSSTVRESCSFRRKTKSRGKKRKRIKNQKKHPPQNNKKPATQPKNPK